jgi:flagellar operon protein
MALPIDSVTALQNSTMPAKPTNKGAELGQVDFMKLIIAQMRNQNPLEPQKDTDFMAQMAQFEALNQSKLAAQGIKAMQGVQELTGAAALIGRSVIGKQVDGTAVARDMVGRELFGAPYAKLSTQQRVGVNDDPRIQATIADARPGSGHVHRCGGALVAIDNVTGASLRQPMAPTGRGAQAPEAGFSGVLQQAAEGLQMSRHAQKRIDRRDLDLDGPRLERLNTAVTSAAQKGARQSVVMLDDLAVVVNIRDRTVVTAMNTEGGRQRVFTNIDSVVIA